MHHALMITDLNNPISNEYRNRAISSFNFVKDIIDIEPYQCYTPKNPSKQIRFNPSKKRSPTEIAILETYYSLFKKIANGEKFIIMEHDAYLREDREEIFRNLLSEIDSFDVWNVGIAVECHTLKQEYAQQFCDNLEDDFGGTFKGPMSLMRKLNNLQSVVYVKDGQTGELCKAKNTNDAAKGIGESILAPVTQCYIPKLGLTNTGRSHNEYTIKTQPQMVFIDI